MGCNSECTLTWDMTDCDSAGTTISWRKSLVTLYKAKGSVNFDNSWCAQKTFSFNMFNTCSILAGRPLSKTLKRKAAFLPKGSIKPELRWWSFSAPEIPGTHHSPKQKPHWIHVNTRYAGLLIKTKAQPIGLANQRRLHIVFQNQQIMTFIYLYDKHAKQLLLQAFQLLWPDLCGSATRMHAAKSPTHSSNPHAQVSV